MFSIRKILDNIYVLVFNDNLTRFFEGTWPLPNGVTYNTYLILGEKNILVEGGVKKYFVDDLLQALERLVDLGDIDYVVSNHNEPDHTGSIPVMTRLTRAKIITSKFGGMLLKKFYDVPSDRIVTVREGEEIGLGDSKIRFYMIPGVHWPDSMITFYTPDKILFSSDVFGAFGALNGRVFDFEVPLDYFLEETKRYFVNIIGSFVSNARKALEKILGLEPEILAPAHGPVWVKHTERVISLYKDLIYGSEENHVVIVYGSMYGFSEALAYYMADRLQKEGITVKTINVTDTHPSYTLSAIWDAKVVIFGGPTYDNGPFLPLLTHVMYIRAKKIKNKKYVLFGSSGWSGGGYKAIKEILDGLSWEHIEPTIEYRGKITNREMSLAEEIIAKIKDIIKS